MPYGLVLAAMTDRGRNPKRPINEDNWCIVAPPAIAPGIRAVLLVADGMGGHQAGEVASQYVADKIAELFSSSKYQEWVDYQPTREDYPLLTVKEILERLHDQISRMSANNSELRGMGTTATLGLVIGDMLYIGHVGDSRAYLVSKGAIRQLTHDHTWVMQQVEQGLMSAQEAAASSQKNQLMQALGSGSVIRVERITEPLNPGDTLVFCSDGLTNVVNPNEIAQFGSSPNDLRQTERELIDLANQRGGPDNITVVMARVVAETQAVTNLTPRSAPLPPAVPSDNIETLKMGPLPEQQPVASSNTKKPPRLIPARSTPQPAMPELKASPMPLQTLNPQTQNPHRLRRIVLFAVASVVLIAAIALGIFFLTGNSMVGLSNIVPVVLGIVLLVFVGIAIGKWLK